ncbi:unnamed protein product [Cuscuta epithymum]|uniref:Uncharacterized protein n=1 Tax=Cuscuta epithymum TaxID=186058 RepID=A0AAV0DCW4_9ASTE|nr:unnamed protein product [Cuscuta epithymum]
MAKQSNTDRITQLETELASVRAEIEKMNETQKADLARLMETHEKRFEDILAAVKDIYLGGCKLSFDHTLMEWDSIPAKLLFGVESRTSPLSHSLHTRLKLGLATCTFLRVTSNQGRRGSCFLIYFKFPNIAHGYFYLL